MKIIKFFVICLFVSFIYAKTVNPISTGAGVYAYKNLRTGNYDYIGSTDNFRRRYGEHKRLDRPFSKDGYEYIILSRMTGATRTERIRLERNLIQKYYPKFNIQFNSKFIKPIDFVAITDVFNTDWRDIHNILETMFNIFIKNNLPKAVKICPLIDVVMTIYSIREMIKDYYQKIDEYSDLYYDIKKDTYAQLQSLKKLSTVYVNLYNTHLAKINDSLIEIFNDSRNSSKFFDEQLTDGIKLWTISMSQLNFLYTKTTAIITEIDAEIKSKEESVLWAWISTIISFILPVVAPLRILLGIYTLDATIDYVDAKEKMTSLRNYFYELSQIQIDAMNSFNELRKDILQI